jgi:hypothetical protein
MQSTIQGLQGEGQLFEKIACSYMMSVPDGWICYVWPHGVNVNGELNWQMMTYIFHPREPFYYKYFFLWGNSQCEGYWFWNVTFFE